ncbi:hypothetical protein LTR15_005538 [Elasticomyces elasticus]|nr:hypothetical protein LTR15_005538 [Elasticomyces elasticus]
MTAALVCAIALSLGHHIFYATLNGQLTPIGSYHVIGKSMSKQQFNTAIGTAYAFLVKAVLTVAISLAYVQVFWWTVKNSRRSCTLAELDTLSALGNIVDLFNVVDRWRHPLLLGLALIFWCAPVATIVTPATLSVSGGPSLQFSMNEVPQFDFASLDFSSNMPYMSNDDERSIFGYNGPSQTVQSIASAVLALGQILPINAPASNTSWVLDFWGPALQCQEVEGVDREAIWVNIWNSYDNATRSWVYLAWAPRSEYPGGQATELPFSWNSSGPGLSSNTLAYDHNAALYLAVLPNMIDMTIVNPGSYLYKFEETASTFRELEAAADCANNIRHRPTPSSFFDDASLLKCSLVNTSYTTAFTYINGLQDIQVSRDATKPSPVVSALGVVYPNIRAVGSDDTCPYLQAEPFPLRSCSANPELLRRLAYQSIFSAFGRLIIGTMSSVTTHIELENDVLTINTSIVTTVLAQTDEIEMVPFGASFGRTSSLQAELLRTNAFPGVAKNQSRGTRRSLKATLEQGFENLTISMLSDPYLQPDPASQFAPSLAANVTTKSIVNFYVYDQFTLWVAYGSAIFFATLAVIAGLVFLIISGASYDTTFSTIVRVAKAAELTVELKDDEGAGYQPLPDRLAKARLAVGSSSLQPQAEEEMRDRVQALLAASEEGGERSSGH